MQVLCQQQRASELFPGTIF